MFSVGFSDYAFEVYTPLGKIAYTGPSNSKKRSMANAQIRFSCQSKLMDCLTGSSGVSYSFLFVGNNWIWSRAN